MVNGPNVRMMAGLSVLLLLACGGPGGVTVAGAMAGGGGFSVLEGTASGTVRDPMTGQGLAGVQVLALAPEPPALDGRVRFGEVLGAGLTGPDGAFVIPGLPLDRPFRLVCQPDLPARAYAQAASGTLSVSRSARQVMAALTARPTIQLGGLRLEPGPWAWSTGELRVYWMGDDWTGEEGLWIRSATLVPGQPLFLDRLPAGAYHAVVTGCGGPLAGQGRPFRILAGVVTVL